MNPDDIRDQSCEVCRRDPLACVCPECPGCGVTGRSECYSEEGHIEVSRDSCVMLWNMLRDETREESGGMYDGMGMSRLEAEVAFDTLLPILALPVPERDESEESMEVNGELES